MSNGEAVLQADIRLMLGREARHVRLFRNNVGVAIHKDGTRVVYGLAPGSSDLVGWTTVVVTPEMVGRELAVFTAAEVKTGIGQPTALQVTFIDAVRKAGGIAGVVRSAEDAMQLVRSIYRRAA